MAAAVSLALQFIVRTKDGLASRLRNAYYKALGVEIRGYCWLRKIEIRRNHSEISLGRDAALDEGVVLLCSGLPTGKKKITIGENTYINRYSFVDASHEIRIGRNVGIGPHCYITDHSHGTAPGESIMAQPLVSDTTTISDNVWLGAGVIVLQGVTIGSNTVVAAGSVVVRDLPSDVFAEGRPARAFKKRA